ncbi:MAG: hypothetical protein RID93_25150, partial [Sandaracinaceae bacterium]
SFKEKEARRLVDQARPHVGAEMTAEQALRVALRGVSVGGCVREELAEYGDSSSRGPTPTWVPPPERHQLGWRDEIGGSRVSLAYPLM